MRSVKICMYQCDGFHVSISWFQCDVFTYLKILKYVSADGSHVLVLVLALVNQKAETTHLGLEFLIFEHLINLLTPLNNLLTHLGVEVLILEHGGPGGYLCVGDNTVMERTF